MKALRHPDALSDTSAPRKEATRVMCVDDSGDITDALRMVIDIETDMECVECLSSADNVVDEARRLRVDVVVMDATMKGMNPFKAITELTVKLPNTHTILFSAWDGISVEKLAVDAGAKGFVCKTENPEKIVLAVREVAAGRRYFASKS